MTDAATNHPYAAELHELVGLGMHLSRAIQARAVSAAEAPPCYEVEITAAENTAIATLTGAFERAARTARRTILLAVHLRDRPPARPEPPKNRLPTAAQPSPNTPERARPIVAEPRERTERPEHVETLDQLAPEHVIAGIRRDLADLDQFVAPAEPRPKPGIANRRPPGIGLAADVAPERLFQRAKPNPPPPS